MSFTHIVYAYLLGGVTFLPLVLVAFVYLHPKKEHRQEKQPLKAGQIEEDAQTGLDCFKQGWLFVTHEHLESQDDMSSKSESVAESQDAKSAYSSLYKLMSNTSKSSTASSTLVPDSPAASVDQSSMSVPTNGVSVGPPGGPAPVPGAPGKQTAAGKKHRYYAVLKHGNLFLYRNEKMQDMKYVIVLSNRLVSIWPRSLSEAALFTKYSSIAILKKDWSRARRISDSPVLNYSSASSMHSESGSGLARSSSWADEDRITIHDVLSPDSGVRVPPGTFFIYTDLNIDKEDWYFALIRATKTDTSFPPGLNPSIYARTLHLETPNMMSLIRALYGSEGQLQSKWFNAIIGRIFLSLQKTSFMKNYLVAKIERKLNKIKTPGFLDKFQITKVDAGNAAPIITFPVLKEINPEGDLLVSLNVHYVGGMSIQLATKVNINLGSRFRTREVDVLLSITLEKITGPMLIKIKPPPSARIWYTYEREPEMSIKIEPVISSRQMSYNIITNSIEKKLKDAIRDSLVLPHWDDIVYCRSPDELYRGGIWEKDREAEDEDLNQQTKDASEHTSDQSNGDTYSIMTTENGDLYRPDSSLVDSSPTRNQKTKVSRTFSDLSKRLRKPKSTHTLGVDGTNCLSDGSMVDSAKSSTTSFSKTNGASPGDASDPSSLNSTPLQRLGEWYAKSEKIGTPKVSVPSASTTGSTYHPPEMITNRRSRKPSQSSFTIRSDLETTHEGQSYDFAAKGSDEPVISRTLDVAPQQQVISKSSPPPLPPRNSEFNPTKEQLDSEDLEEKSDISDTVSVLPNVGGSRANTSTGRKPPSDTTDEEVNA